MIRSTNYACILMLAIFTLLHEKANAQTANCVVETVFSVNIQAKPTAGFTFIASDLSATFSNASVNSINYTWNFGDPGSGASNTSSEANPIHHFSSPGNYTVTLTATNGCGSRSVSQIVQVSCPSLSVTATANGATEICPGASILLTATPGFDDYQWFLDGILIVNGGNSANFTASMAGEYTVEVTDAAGCKGLSQGVSVEMLPLAEPLFSTATNGLNVSFTNTSTNSTSYTWNFGDPNAGVYNTSSETNPTHDFSAPGTYLITLTAMNACGSQIITQEIVIACTPPQVSVASNDPLQFCEGGSALLHATPSNLTIYQWYFNDLPIPSGTSPTLSVTDDGQYKVLVTDIFGCENFSGLLVVNVYPLPAASIASSMGDAVCEGTSLVLSGGIGIDYQWIVPDSSTVFGENVVIPTVNISNNGTYYLTVTDGNGCTSTTEFDLTVNPLPLVSISGLNSDYTEDSPPVQLTGTPIGGIFSGVGLAGDQFDPGAAGVGQHTIYYTYTDANNCINNDSVFVNVSPVSSTNLTEGISHIQVSPNPNNGDFWLEIVLASNRTLNFVLMNSLGQKLANRQELLPSGQSNIHFNGNELSSGVYFLEILDGGQHACLRVIVTK